jgi:hypothetical protein
MNGSSSDNLLSALHRWASRQDENFITDAFSHLLRRLLLMDRPTGLNLIAWLTEGAFVFELEDARAVSVSTQVTTVLGRPDVEIRTSDHLIYIEAKVESEPGDRQLERYLEQLDNEAQNQTAKKTLVLLTRYPQEIAPDLADRVIRKRWYQVADVLVKSLASRGTRDPISAFLCQQFIDFLQTRGVTMEKVQWEMPSGVKSLRSLIGMLAEALAALQRPIAKSPAWEWVGYYLVDAENKKKPYFAGLYYDRPEVLVFETNEVAVVPNAVELAGCGKLIADRYRPGGAKWVNELVLDSEEVHFFALSRERQMQTLEQFLQKSLDAMDRIKITS